MFERDSCRTYWIFFCRAVFWIKRHSIHKGHQQMCWNTIQDLSKAKTKNKVDSVIWVCFSKVYPAKRLFSLVSYFLFESTYFAFICIPIMYFYVDLLVKFRYCEKATKFERNSCFFHFFVILGISELLSNGHVFLVTLLVELTCLLLVEVLLLKYIKRYANRCIVIWSSKRITFFSLTRQIKQQTCLKIIQYYISKISPRTKQKIK